TNGSSGVMCSFRTSSERFVRSNQRCPDFSVVNLAAASAQPKLLSKFDLQQPDRLGDLVRQCGPRSLLKESVEPRYVILTVAAHEGELGGFPFAVPGSGEASATSHRAGAAYGARASCRGDRIRAQRGPSACARRSRARNAVIAGTLRLKSPER